MKKLYCLLFLLCVLMLTPACGQKRSSEISGSASSPTETAATNDGDFPSAKEEPTGKTLEIIKGYTEENLKKEDGLTLLAAIGEEARTADQWLCLNGIYSLSSHQAIVSYSLYDTKPIWGGDGGFQSEDSMENVCRNYLICCDLTTGVLSEPLDISPASGDHYIYLEQNSLLWRWEVGEESAKATGYDGDLRVGKEFTVPSERWVTLTPEGDAYYYVSERKLFRVPLEGDRSREEEISFDPAFSPQSLSSIFQNDKGENVGLMTGIAGNLKICFAIANLDTGELLYLIPDGQGNIYTDNGMLVDNKSWEGEEPHGSYTLYSGGSPYQYQFFGQGVPSLTAVDEHMALFSLVDENSLGSGHTDIQLWLYDTEDGRKLGSARLTADFDYASLSQAIMYPEGDALLLSISAESGGAIQSLTEFYRWDYREGLRQQEDPAVTEKAPSSGLLDDIVFDWDPSYFIPEECPAEFADLRAEADRLEGKYGIEIKISTECKDMLGGYAIAAISDRETIQTSLSVLDTECAKYPEGFFRQLVWDGVEGVQIYLAGILTGVEDDVLDTAGGVTTIENNRLMLALDCLLPELEASNLHHEIAHAIDRKLQADYENVLLAEDEWEALNPFPDMYSYGYQDYNAGNVYREGMEDYIYLNGMDDDKICFIDDYSLTFPTEDRARIFEYAMMKNHENMWTRYPKLREKLRFYARCIRRGFDTSGWRDVLWEKG